MTKKLLVPLKEDLEEKYKIPGNTLSSIAREYNTSHPTIRKWLNGYEIKLKDHLQASKEANLLQIGTSRIEKSSQDLLDNYDWLYSQRITLRKSIETIAEELKVSIAPVNKAVKKHKIPKVKYNESEYKTKLILESKEELEELYKTNDMRAIAKHLGSSAATVQRFMALHGIEPKPNNSYPRKKNKTSVPEVEMFNFIKEICPDARGNIRSLVKGKEIDCYIPSKNIAYEFNGLWYHCEVHKSKSYHYDKTKSCLEKGFSLFHIWQDDWDYKKDLVKSMIRSKLGVCLFKVYGRNCEIKDVNHLEMKEFLNENHIQGSTNSKINKGLYHNNILVALMTFGKSRFNKKYDWELIRYCVLKDHNVVGGFSKLLKNFRKENPGSIVSYADISYSNGNVYKVNGFVLEKINPPVYSYLVDHCEKRVNRTQFMKKNLKDFDQTMSEKEIMKCLGVLRIWNCGTYRFVLK